VGPWAGDGGEDLEEVEERRPLPLPLREKRDRILPMDDGSSAGCLCAMDEAKSLADRMILGGLFL